MREVYGAAFHLGLLGRPATEDVFVNAAKTTLRWMADKEGTEDPASWIEGRGSFRKDSAAWRLETVGPDAARLWQLDWHRYDDQGMVWQTRCQIGSSEGDLRFTGRIAIDSADERLAPPRYEVGRPAVIPLLAQSVGIHQDGRRLGPQPAIASPGGIPDLVDLLLDQKRRLPVIVLTPTGETGQSVVDPGTVAFRLIGLAHVVQIRERAATFALTARLGQLLSVYGGALRLYWPGFSATSSPRDHPLWLVPRIEQVEQSDNGVARRLERQIAAVGVMRVRPDPLAVGLRDQKDREVLGRVSQLQHEIEALLARPGEPGEEWLAELQNAYDAAQGLQAEVTTLQREMEELRVENEQLRRSFAEYSQALNASTEVDAESVPDDVGTSTEALLLARRHLSRLAIPDAAGVAVEELDTVNEAQAWARSAWRGFRALDAYAAEASAFNGFWDWCERGGRGLWPANDRKLALNESEFVMNSRELRERRRFKVDPTVDASGTVLMFAHLKVAEGGGQNIPRIYFHDDTKGPTGKVHIGFFGPHRFVPNKSTN